MRKRIATKVNVYAIGEDMRKKEVRRREVMTLLLQDICNRDSVPMREAKTTLRNEVKWSLMAKEVQALNV